MVTMMIIALIMMMVMMIIIALINDHDDGDGDHHRLDHDDGDGDTLSASRGKRLECSFIYQAEPQGHIFFSTINFTIFE